MTPQVKIFYQHQSGDQSLEDYINTQLEKDGLRALQLFAQQNTYGDIKSVIVHVEPINAWVDDREGR